MTETKKEAPTFSTTALEAFLGEPRVAILSCVTTAGEIISRPVWFHHAGKKFLVHSKHPTQKTRAIEKNPSVSLCIQDDAPPYRYVSVRGTAVVRGPAAEAAQLAEKLAYAHLGRVGGRYYVRSIAPRLAGEDVLIEITPKVMRTMDGTAGVNPALFVLMKMFRWIGF